VRRPGCMGTPSPFGRVYWPLATRSSQAGIPDSTLPHVFRKSRMDGNEFERRFDPPALEPGHIFPDLFETGIRLHEFGRVFLDGYQHPVEIFLGHLQTDVKPVEERQEEDLVHLDIPLENPRIHLDGHDPRFAEQLDFFLDWG
jgi:hypothetical protein